jgi:hypothetical protein
VRQQHAKRFVDIPGSEAPYAPGIEAEKRSPDFKRVDAIVLCGFAVFTLVNFLGRWKGITPFVFLGSDAGIVSSFVAAYDKPELFRHDVLLGDFANFKYYLAIHPFAIHYLNKLMGDYGTAYMSLLLVTPFLQAAGFYLLGRVVFRARYWAVLLSIMSLCPLALPVREFWGIYDDPLPRSLFHAFLPYLLAAALYFKESPSKWPWILAGVGVAFYAHPVSAPHLAFGLWLGMWLFLPSQWPIWKRFGYMFVTGAAFVVVVTPWALNFLSVHGNAASETVSYGAVVNIIANRVGDELLSVGLALSMWRDQLSSWPLGYYVAWAAGCGFFLAWTEPGRRKDLLLIATWALGILIVAVGLTYLEETVCRLYGLRRFQMDSIRGCKYLIPLLLLLVLWPLATISGKLSARSLRNALVMGFGALLVGVWAYCHPPVYFLDSLRSLASGSLLPPVTGDETAAREAVAAVARNTAPGSRIFPVVLPLEIRYSALRPVTYAYKDGGIFADTNLNALVEWDGVRKELEDAMDLSPAPEIRLPKLVALAERTGASYLLVDFHVTDDLAKRANASVTWSNGRFALIKLDVELP